MYICIYIYICIYTCTYTYKYKYIIHTLSDHHDHHDLLCYFSPQLLHPLLLRTNNCICCCLFKALYACMPIVATLKQGINHFPYRYLNKKKYAPTLWEKKWKKMLLLSRRQNPRRLGAEWSTSSWGGAARWAAGMVWGLRLRVWGLGFRD